MENHTIISISEISKSFKIPSMKKNSLKEYLGYIFKKEEFNTVNALRNVNLKINKSQFIGIIGRNGSGKSTLLKIIAGILRPTTGQLKISGSIAPFLELGVGFQPDLTARDNIFLYGSILGLTRTQIRNKFSKIIEFAELEKFVNQKLKNLSSGMQVRLAFATAIQSEADILLIDEVLAVGDLNFQKKCYQAFKKFKQDGKTIIFVSHDLHAVEEFTDYVYLLEKGKITYQGDAVSTINYYKRKLHVSKNAIINQKTKSNKKIKIKGIKLINNKGKEQYSFNTGDFIRVEIYYSVNAQTTNPFFQIQIFNQQNLFCFGQNTKRMNINIGKVAGNKIIAFDIKKINLLSGDYTLTIRIMSDEFSGEVFDSLENIVHFSVISEKEHGAGIAYSPAKWNIN